MPTLKEILNETQKSTTTKKVVPKKVYKESESTLQKRIIFYFKERYSKIFPNCMIVVNPFSSFKMQPFQMNKAKEQGFKPSQPDLLFLYPNKESIGLAIEIKSISGNPYLKDGITLKKSNHLKLQQNYLDCLTNAGYYAVFGIGYEHCVEIIDNYFGNM